MIEKFEMRIETLDKVRTIRVWLPESYEDMTEQRYPVIYMHDGQNLFNKEDAAYGMSWDAHKAMETLSETMINADGTPFYGCIIVGIDNAPGLERLDEYSPWASEAVKSLKDFESIQREIGGDGVAYSSFIVSSLKPYIDANYRTLTEREHTSVIGSSMGGFISLYMGSEYQNVFSKVGAFSTAVWFEEDALLLQLEKVRLELKTKWYLDVGTKETSNDAIPDFNERYINGTKRVASQLTEMGVLASDIKLIIEEDAIHNELAWARRLPDALKWLLDLKDKA